MKTKVVFSFISALSFSSITVLFLFYSVTVFLSEPYLKIVGALIHSSYDENKALFHLVTQSSVLGALGGVLYATQILTTYIASDNIPIVKNQNINHFFIFAFLTPMKGLVAGIIASTIIGGSIFLFGSLETIGKAHLFVIGTACVAGYSEQFLQRIVDVANKKIDKI